MDASTEQNHVQAKLDQASLNVNERVYLVIPRLSDALSKVTVHQRLMDKDGFIYSLQKILERNMNKVKLPFNG